MIIGIVSRTWERIGFLRCGAEGYSFRRKMSVSYDRRALVYSYIVFLVPLTCLTVLDSPLSPSFTACEVDTL